MHVDPTDHLGLVHYWARRFSRTPDEHDDVFSMGVVGLLKACRRFDASRGAAFSTYASYWIRESIIRHLKKEQPFIRVPEKWTVERRIPVRSLNRRVRTADGDGTELADLLPDARGRAADDGATANELRDLVHAALARLPQRDALVLKLRHGVRDDGTAGYPMTLDEVGAVLRISRERVRQLEQRAAARLRRRLAG